MTKTSIKHPPIRIHGVHAYDRGAKARWLLTEIGVHFENIWMKNREFEKSDYMEMNPMGRVPAMEFGDTVLFESGAIASYLSDFFSDSEMSQKIDSPLRAEYLKWMFFTASTLDPFQTRIMIIEDIPPGELYDKKFSALMSDVEDAYRTLELTLSKQPFLVGGRFSTADICASYHLYFQMLWPEFEGAMKKFPKVADYLERMKKHPSAITAEVFSYEA